MSEASTVSSASSSHHWGISWLAGCSSLFSSAYPLEVFDCDPLPCASYLPDPGDVDELHIRYCMSHIGLPCISFCCAVPSILLSLLRSYLIIKPRRGSLRVSGFRQCTFLGVQKQQAVTWTIKMQWLFFPFLEAHSSSLSQVNTSFDLKHSCITVFVPKCNHEATLKGIKPRVGPLHYTPALPPLQTLYCAWFRKLQDIRMWRLQEGVTFHRGTFGGTARSCQRGFFILWAHWWDMGVPLMCLMFLGWCLKLFPSGR